MTSEQQRRVLVVDDSTEVRTILAATLRQRSLVVDQAAGGREAIDLLRESVYSVVLLDLLMPGVDGFEVLDAIHVDPANPPIVLVITGADRSITERLDGRRIHGIIRKPFDSDDIATIVAACADIRARLPFQTMALATMISGAPLIAWLGKWP